MEQPMTGWQK